MKSTHKLILLIGILLLVNYSMNTEAFQNYCHNHPSQCKDDFKICNK